MPADRKPTYADPALVDSLESRIGALEAAVQPDDGGSDRTQQYRQGQAVLGGLAWGSGQDTVGHQGSEFVRNGPVDPDNNLNARLQDLQDQIDVLTLLGSNGSKDLNQSGAGQVSQRKGDDGNTGSDVSLPPPGDVGTILTSNGFLVDPSYQTLSLTTLTGILPAAGGGTGVASPTARGVLIAEGSAAMNVASPGTAGFVLASNGAAADPSFQAATTLVGDATTGAKGVVQLAGDLTGTAALPTVGLNTITNAKLAQAVSWTVTGNTFNSTQNKGDIQATQAGQLLQVRGTALGFFAPPAFARSTTFGAGAFTFTVPANVYELLVLAKGAGAGGGGAGQMNTTVPNHIFSGCGGGEGGLAIVGFAVVPGSTVTGTVGTGGAGGVGSAIGTAGGDTTISTPGSATANGGAGGLNATSQGLFVSLGYLGGYGGGYSSVAGIGGQSGQTSTLGNWNNGSLTFTGIPGSGGGTYDSVTLARFGAGGRGATGSAAGAATGQAGQDGLVTICYN